MQTSKFLLTLILSFGFFVLLLGTLRGESGVASYIKLKRSRDVLLDTTKDLAVQNDQLREEILKIEQSPSFAERVLRDKYHIKNQGEKIVFFAD